MRLDASIAKLDTAVQQKLNALHAVTSVKEIRDINRFLKESERLKKTLYTMGPAHEHVSDIECIAEGEDFNAIDVIVEGCNIIVGLHTVVDYDLIKETQSEWLLDDVFNYISALREAFGKKVPALPGSEEGRKEE
jgi:hypothetical protein